MQIEDDTTAFFGDHAHRLVENFATVAVGGKDVARGAARVHADQDWMVAGRAEAGGRLRLAERLCYPRSQIRDLGHPRQ